MCRCLENPKGGRHRACLPRGAHGPSHGHWMTGAQSSRILEVWEGAMGVTILHFC